MMRQALTLKTKAMDSKKIVEKIKDSEAAKKVRELNEKKKKFIQDNKIVKNERNKFIH